MSTWDRIAYRPLFSPKALILIGVNLANLPCASISIEPTGRQLSARSYVNERPDRNSTSCPGKLLSASPWPLTKILLVSNERRLSGFDYITVTDSKWAVQRPTNEGLELGSSRTDVSLRCPTYLENSHANHTWHPPSHKTACFQASELPSPWVRFPSPAPFSGNARPRRATRLASRH
jgi:hypothetical protein